MRPLLALLVLTSCNAGSKDAPSKDSDDSDVVPQSVCAAQGLSEHPWDTVGPYGEHRHDVAADAILPLGDAGWTLSENWTGCDTLMFVTDTLPVSDLNPVSVWGSDLDALLEDSPKNVQWFFVSRQEGPDAKAAIGGMQTQLDAVLAGMKKADRAWWTDRVHVVTKPAGKLDGWVGSVIASGIGTGGFAIDRHQQLRGLGSFSDVTRSNASDKWPWDNNLAMAARDARYLDKQSEQQDVLDAQVATVVPMWTGEVIQEFAEMDVTLPDATTMAGFDTFQIEVDMRCPDPTKAEVGNSEVGNCGAWDYLAHLWLQEDDGSWTELSRFITSYHRETHWVTDATPMLAVLKAGGTRHFKWEWAPSWNVQPTETRLNLRFSNAAKGMHPTTTTHLFSGGSWNSHYNEAREPMVVPIPAGAKKVELWSVISGHGSSPADQCAEFCNHQHEFTVNGATHLAEFPEAKLNEGCVSELKNGATPNQWGTWWFGRGGWCPGQQVNPIVFDVTTEATAGQDATILYRGLFKGVTPNDNGGDIVLNSWLVVYE